MRAIAKLAGSLPGVLWEGLRAPEPPAAGAIELQLEDEASLEMLAGRYETDEGFRARLNSEVAELLGAPVEPAVRGAPSAAGMGDPVQMGNRVQDRVRSSLYDAARARAEEQGAKLVIFGHTHDASVEELPGGGSYINSGTWTWRADMGDSDRQTWKELFEHPERFTKDRVLSYVRIDYDEEGQPSGDRKVYRPGVEKTIRAIGSTTTSIWHRIEAWFRRLAELIGIDV